MNWAVIFVTVVIQKSLPFGQTVFVPFCRFPFFCRHFRRMWGVYQAIRIAKIGEKRRSRVGLLEIWRVGQKQLRSRSRIGFWPICDLLFFFWLTFFAPTLRISRKKNLLLAWKCKSCFSNRVFFEALKTPLKCSVFEASKLVSTKTLLPKHYYRRQGFDRFWNGCSFFAYSWKLPPS